MWMGERITDKGIGNGVSLVIFVGIMVQLPLRPWAYPSRWWARRGIATGAVALMVIFLATVAAIVAITQRPAQDTDPARQARRWKPNVVGAGSSFLPLKVNQAGVIPIIFAVSVVYLPAQIAQFARSARAGCARSLIADPWFSPGGAPGCPASSPHRSTRCWCCSSLTSIPQ